MKLKNLRNFHLREWYQGQKQKRKEKKAAEPTAKSTTFRLLTFAITLASMMLALSLLPLFPQPLPTILSFLVAFVTFKKPIFGMPVGGLLVGLGLIFNLSRLNFVSMLGAPDVRGFVVFAFLFLFVGLPIIFRSHKAAIAINLGIIAAVLLFFNQTFYLSIPLILCSFVFFKKTSILTAIYYVLISVPLEMMQYLEHIIQIDRVDWWVEPGSSPPIFVPLSNVLKGLEESMLQFRLYDTSKVIYTINDQLSMPPPVMDHYLSEVLSHYLDSLPGIALFLVIVVVLLVAFGFFMRMFFTRSGITNMERLYPTITATVGAAFFFIFVGALSNPLAFEAQVTGGQMAIGIFATVLLTLPALMIDYTPKRSATIDMVRQKAEGLMEKLGVFEEIVNKSRDSIFADVSSVETRMLIIRDKLSDIISKTSANFYLPSEVDEIFKKLESMEVEIDQLSSELDVVLTEYHIFVNCEYSKWRGKFKEIGLEPQTSISLDFKRGLPLNERIDHIRTVLDGAALFASEVVQIAERVYSITRSLYDSALPVENQSIVFAKQKLNEVGPSWICMHAMFSSLNNWRKHYSEKISESTEYLHQSLNYLSQLNVKDSQVSIALGRNFPVVIAHIERAKDIQISVEQKAPNAINVIFIRAALDSILEIAKGVLSIISEELKNKQEAIDLMLPVENYFWEQNVALTKRMAMAMEIILNSENYRLNEVLENLPNSLSCINECVETIVSYDERKELLLNYPVAEIIIEDVLRRKERVSPQDLPFALKYAEEMLKLFYSQSFQTYSFDKANNLLARKR